MNLPSLLSALLLSAGTLLLASCAPDISSLRAHYVEMPPHTAVADVPSGKTPPVINVVDLPAMTERYEASGYVVIGYDYQSTASSVSYDAVSAFARQMGACVVLTNDRPKAQHLPRTRAEAVVSPAAAAQSGKVRLFVDGQYFIYLAPRA